MGCSLGIRGGKLMVNGMEQRMQGLVLVTEAALERLWMQWIAEASKIRRW